MSTHATVFASLALAMACPFPAWSETGGFALAATPQIQQATLLQPRTVAFHPNRGQWDLAVRFAAWSLSATVLLTDDELVLVLREGTPLEHPLPLSAAAVQPPRGDPAPRELRLPSAPPQVVRLRFASAGAGRSLAGEGELPWKASFFLGPDPERWRAAVPAYTRVRVRSAVADDLIVDVGAEGLTVTAATNPRRVSRGVELLLEGAGIDQDGAITVRGAGARRPVGSIRGSDPGRRDGVPSPSVRSAPEGWTITLSPAAGGSDTAAQGAVQFALCLGGVQGYGDRGSAVAIDGHGDIYVTGEAGSIDFPTKGGVQDTLQANTAAFVTKLAAADSSVVYSTYLGGPSGFNSFASGNAIAVDAHGHAYVTGATFGFFPTTENAYRKDPYPRGCGGTPPCSDGFVAELDATGSQLVYSTYIGGGKNEAPRGITVGQDGGALVVGWTDSPDFPTKAAFQGVLKGLMNAFVTKFDPTGSALQFSTFLGGDGQDWALAVAADDSGNTYVAGDTSSADFPTVSALQPALCGFNDAFVVKLSAAGDRVDYGTYLGGSGLESARALAIDRDGAMLVAGFTSSADFPTTNGVQEALAGTGDAFITKLSASGASMDYSTYLGGQGSEHVASAAVDGVGRTHLFGSTASQDFPLASAWQTDLGGETDAFVTVLSRDGKNLLVSSYLGGSGVEGSNQFSFFSSEGGAAATLTGQTVVVGSTSSSDFPATASLNPAGGCVDDVFVVKITTPLAAAASASPGEGPAPLEVNLTAIVAGGVSPFDLWWDFGDGTPGSNLSSPAHTYANAGAYTATVTVIDAAEAQTQASCTVTVAAPCTLACSAAAPVVAQASMPAVFSASAQLSDGCGASSAYAWSFGDGSSSPEQSPHHGYASPGVYAWTLIVTAGGQSCRKTGTITVTASPPSQLLIAPAVAHLTGVGGSRWRTELAVVNREPSTAAVSLVYLSSGPPMLRTLTVPPGAAVSSRDVLEELFGISPASPTSGTVHLVSASRLYAAARTYNLTPGGTYGQEYPALSPGEGLASGERAVIPSIRKSGDFRTNIGAVNLSPAQCSVLFTLYDAGGHQAGIAQTLTLPAGRWVQINDAVASAGISGLLQGYATVEVLTEGVEVWAYASLIDNRTGDPTTVGMVVQ